MLAQVQVFCPGPGPGPGPDWDLTCTGPGPELDLDLIWDLDLSLTKRNLSKCIKLSLTLILLYHLDLLEGCRQVYQSTRRVENRNVFW